MMTTFLLLLLIVIGFVLVMATMRPNEFRVARETVIHAPADRIFPHINDLKAWNAWSPWAKIDANAKITFSGPATGVGTAMTWDGNSKLGKGRMEIVESNAPGHLHLQLHFEKPMKGQMHTTFTLQPQEQGTLVSWRGEGPVNFIGKIFSVFINCEKMTGKMYQQGLDNLKALVEKDS